jgi:hypothetical protein
MRTWRGFRRDHTIAPLPIDVALVTRRRGTLFWSRRHKEGVSLGKGRMGCTPFASSFCHVRRGPLSTRRLTPTLSCLFQRNEASRCPCSRRRQGQVKGVRYAHTFRPRWREPWEHGRSHRFCPLFQSVLGGVREGACAGAEGNDGAPACASPRRAERAPCLGPARAAPTPRPEQA